ncbi:helix-turn-helix transcriptional regulator [Myceligenerans sp. TRM 65318]|uniref:Helix-turn-helix transcriptional regulator n=1 Tax=Myceligenerans pegani TaxID=2776917 RepID=A0ABR9MWD2_9MICO|nr:helix-turn-helix transcriptional regulator [Myceligenerans sp. TRM 65318]MBE3017959.1 helix-turn-helix transcriptional regulator [Myceligenerans sp. TRM 65318]
MKEDDCVIFRRTLERAGRRWSGAILYAGVAGARRFVEYRRYVHGISDRLLTQRLRELERQGFIEREVVPTMPVQILYTPTEVGAELVAALQPLGEWGRKHYDLIEKAPE